MKLSQEIKIDDCGVGLFNLGGRYKFSVLTGREFMSVSPNSALTPTVKSRILLIHLVWFALVRRNGTHHLVVKSLFQFGLVCIHSSMHRHSNSYAHRYNGNDGKESKTRLENRECYHMYNNVVWPLSGPHHYCPCLDGSDKTPAIMVLVPKS